MGGSIGDVFQLQGGIEKCVTRRMLAVGRRQRGKKHLHMLLYRMYLMQVPPRVSRRGALEGSEFHFR